jgi:hypothetical protein
VRIFCADVLTGDQVAVAARTQATLDKFKVWFLPTVFEFDYSNI